MHCRELTIMDTFQKIRHIKVIFKQTHFHMKTCNGATNGIFICLSVCLSVCLFVYGLFNYTINCSDDTASNGMRNSEL